PTGEACLQHGLGVGSRAARNCCIDDLDARVLLLIDVKHSVETLLLAAVRPPAEDLELVAAGCSCCGRSGGRGDGGGCSRGCCRWGGTATCDQEHSQDCEQTKHFCPTRHWCPAFLDYY